LGAHGHTASSDTVYTSHASTWLHQVYLNVQQQGRRDPTTAVNEHIGKARFTATAFISKAKDAGLLPPPKCRRRATHAQRPCGCLP